VQEIWTGKGISSNKAGQKSSIISLNSFYRLHCHTTF